MHTFFSYPYFVLDRLNGFVVLGISLFFILTFVYSLVFWKDRPYRTQYFTYICLTAAASIAAVLANNLILLLACWGIVGLLFYLLMCMGDADSPAASKKMLVIVGGTDALMLLGIAIIYHLSQSIQLDQIRLELTSPLAVVAYLCVAIACFAKAGAMPFHSWIPDCVQTAPLPVVAYLPASLDKLLGIYLLARLSLNLFVMNGAMNAFLMCIGTVTIIAAVMMALVQHNLKRLLGYHAVSQVGYMVLGIGTGNPIGIAGGLFHMLNNAVYKSCLFFSAGNVEYRTKTSELDRLGGLAKVMPVTYLCSIIASLSIAGVPPFNGFVSKWLIYQGLIEQATASPSRLQSALYVFSLAAAMFGSGLTLASFMKMLHAVFLGERLEGIRERRPAEVSWQMWGPCVVLSFICILFGVFAIGLPLKYFIFPAVSSGRPIVGLGSGGVWSLTAASWLLVIGLLLGLIVFFSGKSRASLREDTSFTGGEPAVSKAENMVTGVSFYNTIHEFGLLRFLYGRAEAGAFDLYAYLKRTFLVSRVVQHLHNGVLPTYLVWVLLGMVGLFLVLIR